MLEAFLLNKMDSLELRISDTACEVQGLLMKRFEFGDFEAASDIVGAAFDLVVTASRTGEVTRNGHAIALDSPGLRPPGTPGVVLALRGPDPDSCTQTHGRGHHEPERRVGTDQPCNRIEVVRIRRDLEARP